NHGRGQPEIPILAGQKPLYLLESLNDFASGRRDGAVMTAAAARVSAAMRAALVEHYAARPGLDEVPVVAPQAPDAEPPTAAATAAAVVAHGIPELDLPACVRCHSPGKRPRYPILAGQKAEYLALRLRAWRSGEAVEASQPDEPMPMIARRIPEHLIEPL